MTVNLAIRLLAAAAAAATTAMLLSGCVSIKMPKPGEKTAEPSSSSEKYDLTFTGAAKLPKTVQPMLQDTVEGNDGWVLKSEKLGERTYRDANGVCTATLHSGRMPSDVVTDGDDKAASDRYLASLYGAPEATVKQLAENSSYVYGDSKVEIRSISGTAEDGTRWQTSARVFSTSGFAIFTDITCADGADFDVAFADITTHLEVTTD